MTSRTAWPTVSSSDTWTAAQFNLYCRDNDLAYWVFAAAGDMAYATGAAALARRAIVARGALLTSGASAPSWAASKTSPGQENVLATDDGAPDQQLVADGWTDITDATKTVTLLAQSSVLVLASCVGYNQIANAYFHVRAVVDGAGDSAFGIMANQDTSTPRNQAVFYIYLATGVAAGSRVVKLQMYNNGSHAFNTRFMVIAFAE